MEKYTGTGVSVGDLTAAWVRTWPGWSSRWSWTSGCGAFPSSRWNRATNRRWHSRRIPSRCAACRFASGDEMTALPRAPGATAVVCVECQNGVLGADSVLPALAADSSQLISSVSRLLHAARQFGAHVVHATYDGSFGGRPTGTARLWRVLGPATAQWTSGSAPTTVLPELLAPTDLVIPRHHGLFPTLDSELLPVLKGLGVTSMVLAGVSLNL